MTMTVTMVREHFETDMGTAALDRLLADAYATIVARFGSAGTRVETHYETGPLLFLYAQASAVTSVTAGGDAVAAEDYVLRHSGYVLERVDAGYWTSPVVITYTPVADDARRDRVALDLVKLAAQYNALKSQDGGDYSETLVEYQQERARILSELAAPVVFR